MEKSLYSYIDPGIIHFMIYPETITGEGPIVETIKNIALDDFFTAIEVTWIKDDEIRQEVKKILNTSHLKVYYGAQPRLLTQSLDLNSFDKNERKKAIDSIKDGIDEANEIGAEAVAFLSGKEVSKSERVKAMDLLVDSINEICSYAENNYKDLNVVLEVFDDKIDKKALIGPTNRAKEIAERVTNKHDNFGLMVDLSHIPLLGETPKKSLEPISQYLAHIHIGNCILDKLHEAYGDSHPRFGLDEGENDIEELIEFLETLFDIGYLNDNEIKTVSFEVQPLAGETPELVMANAKRVLKKAWAKL